MGDSDAPAVVEPFILRFAVLTYLVLLPVGHLFEMSVNSPFVNEVAAE